MPAPLPDHERRRILDLLESGTSVADVARETGRSRSTISRAATAAGITLDRSKTKTATEARSVNLKARRVALAERLLDDAERLRSQLWAPCTVYNFGGKDNTYAERQVERPNFRDQQAIMTTVGIALDKVERIVDTDAQRDDSSDLDAFLGFMLRRPTTPTTTG